MNMPQRLGFLGAGQMAAAMATGFVRAGLTTPTQIVASDPSPAGRAAFTEKTSASAIEDNREVVKQSDIVFVAVKPQIVNDVLKQIAPALASRHLVVSIAAGVKLDRLEQILGNERRVIRVMPNTPCLVGFSASGFALGRYANEADADLIQRLLEAVGVAHRLPEHLLDAVTGLSGSGPAYGYLIIDALADGGVRTGLPRAVALELAAQTLLGAAQMVLQTHQHPGVLKDQVTSPAGTTIAGLAVLESRGVRGALIEAVAAAAARSKELGEQ